MGMAQCSFQPQQPLVCDTFKKREDPHSLKSNEMAQCSFQPQRGGDAWQGHLVREEGGGRRRRQEEVIAFRLPRTGRTPGTAYAVLRPVIPCRSWHMLLSMMMM